MYTRRGFFSTMVFVIVYLGQVMIIDQVHLPFGGFSIFLIFTLCWSALSTPEVGAIVGFFAGLFMDFAPSSNGPVGQWALILAAIGFAIAFLRYGDDSLRSNPLSLVVFVAAAVVVAVTLYIIFNALLGTDVGRVSQLFRTVIGNGVWTLAIAPFVLPVASRLHRAIFETREFQ
ncbi:MAG TPA: rod shape-determining protein MreD [Candidatus Nanopelagicaceae bacterium]|jgi:rod shape-determining protein MreD